MVSGSKKGLIMTDEMKKTQILANLMIHVEQASGAGTLDDLRYRVWDCHVDCTGALEVSIC